MSSFGRGRAVSLRAFGSTGSLRRAAGVLKRLAQDKLDLPVQTTQVVIRPALQAFQEIRIDPEQEWFPLGHDITDRSCRC